MGYNLTDGTEFVVSEGQGRPRSPKISGNLIVWGDERKKGEAEVDIYGYDLTTRTEFPISTAPSVQYLAEVSGGTVVWTDGRHGAVDVYGYDMATQPEFPIVIREGQQFAKYIDGEIVVFTDTGGLYGYNLVASTVFPIPTGSDHIDSVSISGDMIVTMEIGKSWMASASIYGYDTGSQNRRLILNLARKRNARGTGLDASGTVLVWTDYRTGNGDIYGYDLAIGIEFVVASGPPQQDAPSISGRVVVWQEGGSRRDIRGTHVSSGE